MADATWVKGYVSTLYPGVVLNQQQQCLFDDLEKVLKRGKAKIL
jgi:hypothetical protein